MSMREGYFVSPGLPLFTAWQILFNRAIAISWPGLPFAISMSV